MGSNGFDLLENDRKLLEETSHQVNLEMVENLVQTIRQITNNNTNINRGLQEFEKAAKENPIKHFVINDTSKDPVCEALQKMFVDIIRRRNDLDILNNVLRKTVKKEKAKLLTFDFNSRKNEGLLKEIANIPLDHLTEIGLDVARLLPEVLDTKIRRTSLLCDAVKDISISSIKARS